jgi:hypothetical protein
MSRPSPSSGKPPVAHTAIVGDVASMWSKLCWNADQFRDIQVSYPDEPEPLAYAAIDACIAAASLKDWMRRALPRAELGSAFNAAFAAAIPLQAMCEAIANTAKHSSHSDGQWGGSVSLDWEEGDESAPEGYVLRYRGPDGQPAGVYDLAANHFNQLLGDWWAFLLSRGLVTADQRTPAWMQRKLRRIFPPLIE